MDEQQPKETFGAPMEYAEADEVPEWFGNIFKALSAGPLLVGFFCGIVPSGCATIFCILSFLA